MNAGPEWIYLKQQFIRRLQMSDKNFLGALTCSTCLMVADCWPRILAHTATQRTSALVTKCIDYWSGISTTAPHQTPSLSTISHSTISAPTIQTRKYFQTLRWKYFEDPPEICYTKGHFVFIGPFGTVRIMKCFNFTHFSAAISSGSLLSPSGE